MHILFDSTLFLQNNVGGVARYLIEVANRTAAALAGRQGSVTVLAGMNSSFVQPSDFHNCHYRGLKMPIFRGSWRLYKAFNDCGLQMAFTRRSTEAAVLHETYYGAPRLWNRRVKRVITVHDMIWEEEQFTGTESWVTRAKRISAQRADGILFNSHSTRAAFRRHYPQRCAEAVVHLGCELRTTRAAQPFAAPWPYILFVGRRPLYKNWARLVEAISAAQLWQTHGLINVGEALSDIEVQWLRAAGAPLDRVMTLRCDDDVLADLYAGADCFVFPSLVEGFGIPLLEAARCGTPIACSDIPVFREILPDGPRFFDPRCPAAIASAIRHCVTSGRQEPGVESARRRAELFSWQRTADETLGFYESLLR